MATRIRNEFRKRRERQRARQSFAIIVRDSIDAITVQDLLGNIKAWNRGAEKIYGYSEKEALTMNIRQLTSPEKLHDLQDFMAGLRNEQVTESFETIRQTKQGEALDIWLTVTALKDKAGHLHAIATTERDITARKIREQELEETVATLQQRLAEAKTQEGIVPICSYCKNIRNDKGSYEQLEAYFYNHGDFRFSHTVCPHCARIHYPGYADTIMKKARSAS